MPRALMLLLVIAIVGTTACVVPADEYVAIDREKALEHPDFLVQGEYVGEFEGPDGTATVALQVAGISEGHFSALAFGGGLPGDGWDGEAPRSSETRRDSEGRIAFDFSPDTVRWNGETFVVEHESEGKVGELEPVERQTPDAGKEPPEGAIVLFDGSSLEHWRDGARMTDDGLLKEGATSTVEFKDATLHVEFMPGYMPDASNQNRANSGVYIQRRYEVQILDSFGQLPTVNGNGSLYNERKPDVNMSYPALQWQSYTIHFTAPRFDDDGEKTANARFTVVHNGVVIHDDVELPHGTGAGQQRGEGGAAPLYLQDHGGDPVRFRNVWIKKH